MTLQRLAIVALLLSWPLLAAPSRRTPPPDSPQKRKEKPVIIPVPDAAWQPITRTAAPADPMDVLAVKRAASLAHQTGHNRVMGVAASASAEQLLAWGANQLVV